MYREIPTVDAMLEYITLFPQFYSIAGQLARAAVAIMTK
jgi:hypothetical protein